MTGSHEPRVSLDEAIERARDYFSEIDERLSRPNTTIGNALYYERCALWWENLLGEPYCRYDVATWDLVAIDANDPTRDPFMFQWSDQYQREGFTGRVVEAHHQFALVFDPPIHRGPYFVGEWGDATTVDSTDLQDMVDAWRTAASFDFPVEYWALRSVELSDRRLAFQGTDTIAYNFAWESAPGYISGMTFDARSGALVRFDLPPKELETWWGFDPGWHLGRR